MRGMSLEVWIDGLNLFHRWEATAPSFHERGMPDERFAVAVDSALAQLAAALGTKRRGVTVFLDGGVRTESVTRHGIRVRFAGPGLKADDLMQEALDARGNKARLVQVVTDDRALAAALRARGAKLQRVEKFAQDKLKPKRGGSSTGATYKQRTVPAHEIEAWLDIFSEETDDSGNGRQH